MDSVIGKKEANAFLPFILWNAASCLKSRGKCVWGDTGAAVTGMTTYTIGGNNYTKLRNIAKLFDFDVDWRDVKAWIEPDVSPYTED